MRLCLLECLSAWPVRCWDSAKLATPKRGQYLSLYVVMDLFSRFIVAWMLSRKENSALASYLMTQAVDRYAIKPGSLKGFTPSQVFTGQYVEIAAVRQAALDRAYAKHPKRFTQGPPVVELPAQEVFINPIPVDADKSVIDKG